MDSPRSSYLDRKPLEYRKSAIHQPIRINQSIKKETHALKTLSMLLQYRIKGRKKRISASRHRMRQKNAQIDERTVRGYMMRAHARLADPVCLMRPRAADLSRPCKLHNRPRGHPPYPVVAGGNHNLVNPRAANGQGPSANKLIGGRIGLN